MSSHMTVLYSIPVPRAQMRKLMRAWPQQAELAQSVERQTLIRLSRRNIWWSWVRSPYSVSETFWRRLQPTSAKSVSPPYMAGNAQDC